MVFLKEELLAGAGLVQGCADGMAQLAAAGDKEEMLSGEEFPDKGVFEGAF